MGACFDTRPEAATQHDESLLSPPLFVILSSPKGVSKDAPMLVTRKH
jgi:hypothetical protein